MMYFTIESNIIFNFMYQKEVLQELSFNLIYNVTVITLSNSLKQFHVVLSFSSQNNPVKGVLSFDKWRNYL